MHTHRCAHSNPEHRVRGSPSPRPCPPAAYDHPHALPPLSPPSRQPHELPAGTAQPRLWAGCRETSVRKEIVNGDYSKTAEKPTTFELTIGFYVENWV